LSFGVRVSAFGCASVAAAVLTAALAGGTLAAQPQPGPTVQAQDTLVELGVERSDEPFTLTYLNRPIVTLRARVLGRHPRERAAGAVRVLDEMAASGITGPISSRSVEGVSLIGVGSRIIVALNPQDVDDLAGETLPGVTAQTVARLEQALGEAVEVRTPGVLLRAAGFAVAGLALGLLALVAIGRTRQLLSNRLSSIAEATLAKSGLTDLDSLRASRLLDAQRRALTALSVALQLLVAYGVLAFALRQFPYTRSWGESLGGLLLRNAVSLGFGIVHALPGLFTIALIFLVARVVNRVIALWFKSVERGQIKIGWLYPETAQPTRRLAVILVWLFAVVVAYPYMPGSGTDAFKGVSVFLGLMLTFGSSGLVNQIMSGFMVTYSRALRVGDFVRTGDVEGTVTHLGVLSTKIRTLLSEEVTVPNAVIVAQTTTDYSRVADVDGVLTPTSVTIGYDAPWRQIHALLLEAAARTPGLRAEPAPHVLQTGLEDFYVRYTLYVCLEHQESRLVTMDALYRNIQDAFNEQGVQIMSPHYLSDPATRKVVPKEAWFPPPVRVDPPSGGQ
jgi:small-conductance mechanosensitive channel